MPVAVRQDIVVLRRVLSKSIFRVDLKFKELLTIKSLLLLGNHEPCDSFLHSGRWWRRFRSAQVGEREAGLYQNAVPLW